MRVKYYVLIVFSVLISCKPQDPNSNAQGQDILDVKEITTNEQAEIIDLNYTFSKLFYVPIYSDIYIDANNQKNLLAATLSLRNTSEKSDLVISRIEYYSTSGELVRKYLDKDIVLQELETINYVIEKEDDRGGAGANFLVEIHSRDKNVKPIVEAIMIGEYSNKAFAFTSTGVEIN